MTSHWRSIAMNVIGEVHASLPVDATLKERTKAIDAAYPFGERAHHPYKVWLEARKKYLARFGYRTRTKPVESPLERAMRRSKESTP